MYCYLYGMSYLYSKFYMPLSKMYRVSPKKFTLDFLEILRMTIYFCKSLYLFLPKFRTLIFLSGHVRALAWNPSQTNCFQTQYKGEINDLSYLCLLSLGQFRISEPSLGRGFATALVVTWPLVSNQSGS